MRTYKSLLLSIIDYGAIIYGAAPKSILQSLNSIHNQGIGLSIGLFRSSPMSSILCEANIPPLDIRHNMLSHKFAIKRLVDNNYIILPYLFTLTPPSIHLKKKLANIYTLKNRAQHNKYTIAQIITSYTLHIYTMENEN